MTAKKHHKIIQKSHNLQKSGKTTKKAPSEASKAEVKSVKTPKRIFLKTNRHIRTVRATNSANLQDLFLRQGKIYKSTTKLKKNSQIRNN